MPPTVWCAQHAVRFPFNPGSDEQTCPAGHSVRLEGVVGYCPTCDMQWDVREVEQPETCPYCQTGNVRRHLCHTCQRLTYLPPESADTTCQGCGTPFAQTVLPHACRVLRAEVVTGRQVCPACQESIRQRAPAPTTKQSTNGVTPAAVPAAVPAAASETGAEPTAGTAEDTGGIRLTGPVRVRALHATYGSRLVRVHFDYNRRRFFRNEKGLFLPAASALRRRTTTSFRVGRVLASRVISSTGFRRYSTARNQKAETSGFMRRRWRTPKEPCSTKDFWRLTARRKPSCCPSHSCTMHPLNRKLRPGISLRRRHR